MKQKRLSLTAKKGISGYLFILPWFLGFLIFFLQPLIQTFGYSVTNMTIKSTGGYVLKKLSGGIFSNYIAAFTGDAKFPIYLWGAVQNLLYQVPVIVVFSLFIAIILNQKFRGRTLMRAIFFLPVIITSGIIISITKGNLNGIAMGGNADSGNLFSSVGMYNMLTGMGTPAQFATYVSTIINNIMDTVWMSGVQILLFTAAILSIPSVYYEVASVEGATSWEAFWKVTFPLVLPYIMVNTIYTIIDSFASYSNDVMNYIITVLYKQLSYSYGSALSWIYFLVVMLLIGLVYLLMSRRSHYSV